MKSQRVFVVNGTAERPRVMAAKVVTTDRHAPPKTDLNLPPWPESGRVFNFLASYSARNAHVSPQVHQTRGLPFSLTAEPGTDLLISEIHSVSTYIICLNGIIRLTQIQTAGFFPNH